MKVSREQAAENRERILAAAARLFRERGFDGIGVADVMKSAGLTHGGFYGQFESKEDLAALACGRALEESAAKWARWTEGRSGRQALKAVVEQYLSPRHLNDPGNGCVVAALGAEAARRDAGVKGVFTRGLEASVERLMAFVPGRTAAARRRKAMATYAGMVGALVLARAVDDPKLATEILEAARAEL